MPLDAPEIAGNLSRIMWKHIYTGAMGSTYFSLSVGMFLVAYGRLIGIGYRAFGILGGLTSVAVAVQLLGAHFAARGGRRRPLWFAYAMGERLARGLAIVSAYYLSQGNVFFMSVVFVALLSVGSGLGAIATPPWFSWMADLIPEEQHGRFWGRRSFWTATATSLVLLPCAIFYDWGKAEGFPVEALLIVFAIGLLLGYVDLFIHNTIPEPTLKAVPESKLWPQIVVALRDRGFRPWLVFTCAWHFSLMLGASMCVIYFVDDLFADNFTGGVVAISIVPLVAVILTSRRSGAFVDRYGTRRVLTWSHLIWALVPVPWLFAEPSNAVWVLTASNLVGMTAVSAAANAGVKFVTRFPKREDRAMYFAVANSIARISGGLGAVVAGEVLTALENVLPPGDGASISGFHVLFAISIVLRLSSVALVRRLPLLESEKRIQDAQSDAAASPA